MRSVHVPLALAALMALAGCDTTRAPSAGRLDPLPQYPKVTIARTLNDLVVFSEPIVTNDPAVGPLHVVTPCRSVQDGTTRVQYQYEWFDEAGRPLEPSGWKYLVVPPRQQVFMESNSLSSRAKDWRLTVKVAG